MILLVIRNEAEASQMFAWASRFAEGSRSALEIVVALDGEGQGKISEEESKEAWVQRMRDSLPDWAKLSWCRSSNRLQILLDELGKQEVELLVVGKHNSSDREDPDVMLSRGLFERATCPVLVMRLGEGMPDSREVLVPCSGGRHSRRALKLAFGFAPDRVTALFVTVDADEVSHLVGDNFLKKAIERAEVSKDQVRRKVVLSGNVREGIRKEIEEGDYGLVIVGAGAQGRVRRKLFGIVPARLLRAEAGLAVAVLRAPKAVSHRFRDWLASRIALTVPQLSRDDRIALMEEIEGKARWNFDFAALMAMATMIASLGLLANSGAVVIGAMLVAPLMMPLIGSGLALVQGNWPLWTRSIKAVSLGFLAALFIGLFSGLLASWTGFSLTEELAARGKPTLLDLGIAFVSGVAASYCLARPKLSGALAGVAIAAALVPPIATVGISIGLGQLNNATGAALLFGTNVVTVILGAAVNFWLAGLRGHGQGGEWRRRIFILLMLASIGCAVPLTLYLLENLGN
ncbi:DUF389 domain-containing protein [Roseibacillus persicicus]|uniref:DUF389 domain-containing protein n=1 Tax=Roseibacillus persicicus TaxID=454148 RepID=UPI00280D57CE|nr:DUF389 domain-containing protein [Roseibacillus persicicus]MDQ8190488.1 DUF389 domain-containing protein [Roseibacillus persicicus]